MQPRQHHARPQGGGLRRAYMLILCALVGVVLIFNTRLITYGSSWCDQRVAEKDKSLQQALDQMHEALEQQDASLEALRGARQFASFAKKLARLAKGDRRLGKLLEATELLKSEGVASGSR